MSANKKCKKKIKSKIFFFQTAEWEARKQSLESKMPSQMKKEADMESRQPETLTQYSRPQVTAAQVETYQMTKTSEHLRRHSEQLDSSLSASPTATTLQRSTNNNAHEVGRAHVLPDDRNLVNSGEFCLPFTRLWFKIYFVHDYWFHSNVFCKMTNVGTISLLFLVHIKLMSDH